MFNLAANDAVSQALAEEMRRDPWVLMFGEGVATKRADLLRDFGAARVRNTPLAEGIIAGTAVGAAAMGLRPVIDLLFAPFMTLSMDAIVNSAGKLRFLSGGQFRFPMVVMPSSPADFKGLLKAAIRDDNPVLFFMDLALGYVPGEVPEGEHVVPLGRAFDALKAPPPRVTGPDAPTASSWVLEQAALPPAGAILLAVRRRCPRRDRARAVRRGDRRVALHAPAAGRDTMPVHAAASVFAGRAAFWENSP